MPQQNLALVIFYWTLCNIFPPTSQIFQKQSESSFFPECSLYFSSCKNLGWVESFVNWSSEDEWSIWDLNHFCKLFEIIPAMSFSEIFRIVFFYFFVNVKFVFMLEYLLRNCTVGLQGLGSLVERISRLK